jgi:hypothetical protein
MDEESFGSGEAGKGSYGVNRGHNFYGGKGDYGGKRSCGHRPQISLSLGAITINPQIVVSESDAW